jgi:hypothetical protein
LTNTCKSALRDAPCARRHHFGLAAFFDKRFAMRAAERRARFELDMAPHDLGESAALRAGDLKHALVALRVGAQHVAGVLDQGCAADDDLAIWEAQRALLGERNRVALRADFAGIRLIDQQHPRAMPPQIARSLCGDDLQAAARIEPVQDGVAPALVAQRV